MSAYIHGEYMDLFWEEGPEEVYVRGHVSPDVAEAAVEAYHGPRVVEHAPFVEAWGRWSCEGQDEWGNAPRMLRCYDAPGRGRFPIMRAAVISVAHEDPWRATATAPAALED
jgi:hypothetical protein